MPFIERRMLDILQGPKSHDIRTHLTEDLSRHGNPAGFDCSAGESKMKMQKYKNTLSNKSAPSIDVAVNMMKTEVIRHIFDGGALNGDGSVFANQNVLEEAKRTRAFRSLLGTETKLINNGRVSRMIGKP